MRNVTLLGTEIRTSALGFGTSSLMGRLTKTESLRLLAVAYEEGVRHFDTAPSYGYGEAEEVLGAFLRSRQDVTVATKFGLSLPAGTLSSLARLKNIARPVLRAVPGLRTTFRTAIAARNQPVARFDAQTAAKSLALSLKRLGRSIDIFLLHECRFDDLRDDRLLAFLQTARERGEIRAFGIATDLSTITRSVDARQPCSDVIQFANSEKERSIEQHPQLATRACITHSPFGGIGKVRDSSSASALSYAARSNPNGIVLFSSQRSDHIVENVRVLSG